MAAHLIRTGDAQAALAAGAAYIAAHVTSEVKAWFLEDSLDLSTLDARSNIGWVRWAFTLAVGYLRQGLSYEQAVLETLLKGGDTDTNAAIVGGLMGALHGVGAIPEYMSAPVLAFDPVKLAGKGHKRPEAYAGGRIPDLVSELMACERL